MTVLWLTLMNILDGLALVLKFSLSRNQVGTRLISRETDARCEDLLTAGAHFTPSTITVFPTLQNSRYLFSS
jgi:hypothetical protein